MTNRQFGQNLKTARDNYFCLGAPQLVINPEINEGLWVIGIWIALLDSQKQKHGRLF